MIIIGCICVVGVSIDCRVFGGLKNCNLLIGFYVEVLGLR